MERILQQKSSKYYTSFTGIKRQKGEKNGYLTVHSISNSTQEPRNVIQQEGVFQQI